MQNMSISLSELLAFLAYMKYVLNILVDLS